jgi:hypothetical protein
MSHQRAQCAERRTLGSAGGCAAKARIRTKTDTGPLRAAHPTDASTAREVTAGYARLIASGSCLVISCATYDDEALAKRLAAEYTAGQFVNHTREDVVSFFAGLDLVGPGVSEAQIWRAWMPQSVLRHREGHVLAGVARRQA